MTPESEIRRKVQCAIDKFLQRDSVLLEIDVNERTMTHKLAEYVQQEFQGWDVDCEYNRKIKDLKTLPQPPNNFSGLDFWQDTDAKTVYPDIIVHKRKSDENLLVIEAKKSSSGDKGDWNKAKLRAFKEEPYKYRMAFFVSFRVGGKEGKRVDLEGL
jgi:hypothetical protein